MRLLAQQLLIALSIVSGAAVAAAPDAVVEASAAVLKVRALFPDGSVSHGSAVILGPAKLVTNCHVVYGSSRIEIIQAYHSYPAALHAKDIDRDLCYLDAAVVQPAPEPRGDLVTGERIFAVGFPAKSPLAVNEGWIVALHDYEGVKVIQVSAPFNPGCSGGALFDEQGRLAGIITFKDVKGGPFHFALPVVWLDAPASGERQQKSKSPATAFWQHRSDRLPHFLRAALLEAEENWAALGTLARQWIKREPLNSGAWIALGTAYRHLGREKDAEIVFAEARRTESLRRNQSVHATPSAMAPRLISPSAVSSTVKASSTLDGE
jgi:serine protease Do